MARYFSIWTKYENHYYLGSFTIYIIINGTKVKMSLSICLPHLYPTTHSLPLGPKVHSGPSDCIQCSGLDFLSTMQDTAPPQSSMQTSQTHDQNSQTWTSLRVFILLTSAAMGRWYSRHFITLWTLHTRFQNQENPEVRALTLTAEMK